MIGTEPKRFRIETAMEQNRGNRTARTAESDSTRFLWNRFRLSIPVSGHRFHDIFIGCGFAGLCFSRYVTFGFRDFRVVSLFLFRCWVRQTSGIVCVGRFPNASPQKNTRRKKIQRFFQNTNSFFTTFQQHSVMFSGNHGAPVSWNIIRLIRQLKRMKT